MIGIIITVISFVMGVSEHRMQGKQDRAEYFLEIRHQFRDNPGFQNITEMITQDSDSLLTLSPEMKANYAGFLEEIGLLSNSGLVRFEVANYIFGFYAIQCWKSKKFWTGLEQDDWVVLEDFAKRLEKAKANAKFDSKNFQI